MRDVGEPGDSGLLISHEEPNVGSVLRSFATVSLAALVTFAEIEAFAQELHYSPEERLDAIDA